MLALSRQKNESIIIAGGLITVQVIDIRGSHVRLGVVAPKSMPVHRREVHEAILRNPTEAVSPPTASIFADREMILEFTDPAAMYTAFESGLVQFSRTGA